VKPQALLTDNPVLTLSLRRAMRRGSTFALQFAYLAALLALTALIYAFTFARPTPPAAAAQGMGRSLFLWLGLVQMLFLSMSASMLGAASIALEREQRTFEALRLTRLSVPQILAGKYGALLLLHTLLIVSSIPIACLGFVFGGVSPSEVFRSTLLVFLSMAAALAVGLAASAHCARSALASSIAAAISLGGLLGVPALVLAYAASVSSPVGAYESFLVVVSPLFAEIHLFEKLPGVSIATADGNALVLSAITIGAWFAALARLREEAGMGDG
jgi:ABC-type Na+ efflux pump permease subunit